MWLELSIEVPKEYVEPVSYLFGRYGRGFSVEDEGNDLALLRTYLPSTSIQRRARIEVGIKLVSILQPMGELVVTELKEADWETAWKAHFTLLKVGRHLVIKPSWIDYEALPGEAVIELDPGMAFGTGYHPTTRLCLEALEDLVQPGADVLDMGTGSGILALGAAHLGASSVLALDIDPTAVKVARKNLKASGIGNTVVLARGGLPHRLAPDEHFDLATANISAKTIQEKAPYLLRTLKLSGTLIASGILETQQDQLVEGMTSAGFAFQRAYHIDDWVGLRFSRSI